jgi:hypothetical protein
MSELSLEKLRIEKARQKMLAQEYQLRAGELVDAEKVDREMFRIDRWVRERWLAFPASMAPKLAGRFGCDETKAFEVLGRLVREQIDQLPRWRGCVVEIGLDVGIARQIDAGFAAADTRGPGGGRKPISVKCAGMKSKGGE